jgi:hypothetical protein
MDKKRKYRREDGIGNVLKRLQQTHEIDNEHLHSITSTTTSTSTAAPTSTTTPLEIVVLIGISCSGKTTFARRHFPHHAKLARKHLRARPGAGASRDDKLIAVLARHLQSHRSVVLDAAHASRRTRRRAVDSIRAALERIAAGSPPVAAVVVRTVGYVFAIHTPRFLARNRRRAQFDASVRATPDAVILREASQFEWPSSNEFGFDELHFVSTTSNDDDDDADDASASNDFQFHVTPFLGPQLAAASSIIHETDAVVGDDAAAVADTSL